jgi:signal recognition particle GTPase
MFGFLKKKLSEGIEKIKNAIKAPEDIPIEQVEEEISKAEKELAAKEEIAYKEQLIEAAKYELKPEIRKTVEKPYEKAIKPPREGLIARIKKAVTEKKISEADIKDILFDLHISLIQSDVALGVAEKITEDLRAALVGKFIPRRKIDSVVRDALRTSILDILKIDKLDLLERVRAKKPFLIVFLGFNGSGKCVSGKTQIPLADGKILQIEEIYEEAKRNHGEEKVDGGFCIKTDKLKVLSVNPATLKIEPKTISHLWKLKKDLLLDIELENGQKICVTPEHPFFVLERGRIQKIRADRLSTADYIMVPAHLCIKATSGEALEQLERSANRKLYIYSSKLISEIYKIIKERWPTLREARRALGVDAAECTFTIWKKRGVMPTTFALDIIREYPQLRQFLKGVKVAYKKSRAISLPIMNEKFAEFFGLLMSEGYMQRGYVEFTNSNEQLLNRFKNLAEQLFGLKCDYKPDKRNPKVKKVRLSNRTLTHLLETAFDFPLKGKSSTMKIPQLLLQQPDKHVAAFLRAYWEGDGCIPNDQRVLEVATASKVFADQLSVLLLRFGIIPSRSSRLINGKRYYRIQICGKRKTKLFREKIGTLTAKRDANLRALVAMPYQFEKTELIPNQGPLLRHVRDQLSLTQLGMAEQIGVSYNIPIPIKNLQLLANVAGDQEIVKFFKKISQADVRWLKVAKIQKSKLLGKWVYDLSVPNWHNFVAGNFVVHNTTSIAKIAWLLKQHGLRCVLAAADTFRAASIEQLEEHGRALDVPVIKHKYGADPAAVIFDAVKHASAKGIDVVLADTAGRSHANIDLMAELQKICRVNRPDLKILTLDALTGNDIYDQCRLFDKAVGVDGLILAKADVYDRGGAVLSAAHTLRKPILYLGVGQRYQDLQLFSPEQIARSLL